MSAHKNYFEIEADTYYELGLRKGMLFGDFLHKTLDRRRPTRDWVEVVEEARLYLPAANRVFPDLIGELKGYAEAARVPFEELWSLSLEDEVAEFAHEKCTTIVTNDGTLIAHNEDWEADSADAICVLRKRVGKLHMLELFYLNTLGGNSISINSHGFVHAINSLAHTDRQMGVPKNVVARWLSETQSPDADFEHLAKLKRGSGYHHTIVGRDGKIWSIECSATQQVLSRPASPFTHTNHYLTQLSKFEDKDDAVYGTHTRYQSASTNMRAHMTCEALENLTGDGSQGPQSSIFNERTIARAVVDTKKNTADIWLRREPEKGWISYKLPGPDEN